jgi:hypothetical protein
MIQKQNKHKSSIATNAINQTKNKHRHKTKNNNKKTAKKKQDKSKSKEQQPYNNNFHTHVLVTTIACSSNIILTLLAQFAPYR